MANSQKTPFALSIQNFVQDSIDDKLQGQGQGLPCTITAVNGAIVTVNFDINNAQFTPPPVTCPTIGSQYIRTPLQVGDKGVCLSANARLGGNSGLGLGVAPLANPSNLGGLVFVPIGNINWTAVDPRAVVLIAPNGAVIQTTDGTSTVTISESQIALNYGGNTIVINSSGIGITGTLTINGEPYLAHEHSGVTTGGSNTGGVV